jgi:hypothetical protein
MVQGGALYGLGFSLKAFLHVLNGCERLGGCARIMGTAQGADHSQTICTRFEHLLCIAWVNAANGNKWQTCHGPHLP